MTTAPMSLRDRLALAKEATDVKALSRLLTDVAAAPAVSSNATAPVEPLCRWCNSEGCTCCHECGFDTLTGHAANCPKSELSQMSERQRQSLDRQALAALDFSRESPTPEDLADARLAICNPLQHVAPGLIATACFAILAVIVFAICMKGIAQ